MLQVVIVTCFFLLPVNQYSYIRANASEPACTFGMLETVRNWSQCSNTLHSFMLLVWGLSTAAAKGELKQRCKLAWKHRKLGAQIAQLLEHQTQKPGAIRMLVWVPRCGKGFLSQGWLSVQTLAVSVQPPCAVACINTCAHVKNLKHWQPYHCLGTKIYYTH